MNTDWTRKARDSEGEKYLEKAIRLDKYLADMGKGTRTELKEMIRRGRITVNGVIVKKPETKIKKGEDTICLDNAPVEYVELEYYLLNKPQGVISATEDRRRETPGYRYGRPASHHKRWGAGPPSSLTGTSRG